MEPHAGPSHLISSHSALAWQKSSPSGRQARASEDVRDSSESGTIHPRPGLRGPFRFPGNLRGPEHLCKSFGVTIVFKRGKKSCAFHPEGVVAGGSQSHRKTLKVRRFCGRVGCFPRCHAHDQEMRTMMVALKLRPLHFRHVLSNARAVYPSMIQKEVLPPSVMRCFDRTEPRVVQQGTLPTPVKRGRMSATRFALTKLPGIPKRKEGPVGGRAF